MPQAVWTGSAATFAEDLPRLVTDAMTTWKVRSPAVGLWLRLAGAQLPSGSEARVVLEFDETVGPLSFDTWVGELRVYGADDWIG